MPKLIVTKPASFLVTRPARAASSKAPTVATKRTTAKPSARASLPVSPERLLQQLALAVWIERQIDAGEFANYSAAAKRLGVSRARVSQLLRVMELPVEGVGELMANGLLWR